MRSSSLAALLVALSTEALGAGHGPDVEFSGGFPVTSASRVFPVEELRRGDLGVGYTVLAEDKVEPFGVEVLGVMKGMVGPGQDVILARLSGENIEFTGVIAGMSGSPVYIDGRLVGAVAYRFGAFSKQPIAGITPIRSMLDIYSDSVEPESKLRGAGPAFLFRDRGLAVADFRDRDGLPAAVLPRAPRLAGVYDPAPIETPVMISGLDPVSAADLRQRLEGAGFVAASGGGAAGAPMPFAWESPAVRRVSTNGPSVAGAVRAAPIAPGAPIAALLMRGDVNVAAIGTVTLVEQDRVLAFGHPFLGFGHVSFPMATAAILNTLASDQASYKQGVPSLEVGAIRHDRLTAIAGTLGEAVRMVPVRVRIGRFSEPEETLSEVRVEIVDSPVWLPVMLESVVAGASARRLSYEAGGTIDFKVRMNVGDRAIEYEDAYSAESPTRVPVFVARDVANTAALIAQNEIKGAEFRGIDVEIRAKPEVALAQLEEIVPARSTVLPGEVLQVSARLRTYRGGFVNVPLAIPIPRDAEGELDIHVGGGVEADRRDGEVYGQRFPRTLEALLGILEERRPARGVYARVYHKRPGLRRDAELLSSLPVSQRALLEIGAGRATQPTQEAFGPEVSVPFPDVVVGSASLKVRVE